MGFKQRIGVVLATLAFGFGTVMTAAGGAVAVDAATAEPAQAATVVNMYECHPGTGWCYQTNTPYNPAFPRGCRWNYTIPTFSGGMYYTGCTQGYWRPEVH